VPGFSHQVGEEPVSISLLEIFDLNFDKFGPAQTAASNASSA
jgi:hypothetical protein